MCKTMICFSAPSVNDRTAEMSVVKINQFNLSFMGFSQSYLLNERLKQKLCHRPVCLTFATLFGNVPKVFD